jgi:hypothetical protein
MPKTRLGELLINTDRTPREDAELADAVKQLEGALWDMEELVNAVKSSGVDFRQGSVVAGQRTVSIDDDGISISQGGNTYNAIRWLASLFGGDLYGRIITYEQGSGDNQYGLMELGAYAESTADTSENSAGRMLLRTFGKLGNGNDRINAYIQLAQANINIVSGRGGNTSTLTISADAGFTWDGNTATTNEAVFNEAGNNMDFRVEGLNVDDVFKVDAGLDQVLVGTSIAIKERAASQADTANYGQLWVKDDDPNILRYTDGDGTEFIVNMTAV